MIFLINSLFSMTTVLISALGLELPANCKTEQYYDPNFLSCHSCPANASMVTSSDRLACSCDDHSIPAGPSRCKHCGVTEMVSADGTACVPRRCQNSTGGVVCRKCPSDYIAVTQNHDGSPTKEVLCVKCTRGYKAQGNHCVRCETCICGRNEVVVRGKCVPKRYVIERPKYEDTSLHPNDLLDIVKYEYLCVQNDLRSCRKLADECVKNYYPIDLAGPCRLWLQPKLVHHKGLPQLTLESTSNDKNPGELTLSRGKNTLLTTVAAYTSDGGIEFLQDPDEKPLPCLLPHLIIIGNDVLCDYHVNISKLPAYETLSPYLNVNGDWIPILVSMRKPSGFYVPKGTWTTNKFRRYFLIRNFLSTTANMTNTVYLRTLVIRVRIQRDKSKMGSLKALVSMEAQYANKSPQTHSVSITLRVEHEMPSAGVLRSLEIWGGVLGALLALYAVVQWRGVMRRGGVHYSLLPILAACVADVLYFAAGFSTLHALASEAGTLGLTLPLSRSEEYMIRAFVYSAVSLKTIKVVYFNWNHCRCDIFFLDWTEYNTPLKDKTVFEKSNNWKASAVAREWCSMQTERRAPSSYTVILTLVILQLMKSWQMYLPKSTGYLWAVSAIAWWSSYTTVLLSRWILDRVAGPPTAVLPKVCAGVGISLLVFQEEFYAHYVHGRNDDSPDVNVRTMSGPLATCRIVCAPQLRVVCKQLSTPGHAGLGERDTRQALLSRFLAAFFERALDGVSWVASERTILERLLDVELVVREAINTSTLLYDPDGNTPSCFTLTWWGEEWTLATFDAMLFGCVLIGTEDYLLAALVTITVWQVMKYTRSWFGKRNIREKITVGEINVSL